MTTTQIIVIIGFIILAALIMDQKPPKSNFEACI